MEQIQFDRNPLNRCIYGDKLDKVKDDSHLLLGFVNVNGLKQEKWKEKNKAIIKFLKSYQFDIFGMAETNLHWASLDPTEGWEERMEGVWESMNHNLAYNQQDSINQVWQPGGCLQVSCDRAAHRCIGNGKDPSGLGRWCWTRYRGRHDVTLRIITAYRPCHIHNPGEHTAHSQQQRYLHSINDMRSPRQAMMEDLAAAIQLFREAGDQIVLMIDLNEDVTKQQVKDTFENMGLKEAITDKHTHSGYVPTYQRGSNPIDGIYVSPTLQISTGGYFPFGAFPSDHRFLWVKIDFTSCFGYNMSPLISPAARRHKDDNPDCVRKFNAAYEEYIRKHNLHLTAFELQEELMQSTPTPSIIRRYNALRQERIKAILYADKKCRKLKMGEVPWSRTLQKAMDTIALWKAVISRKRGTRVSTRFISRLEKHADVENSLRGTLIQAQQYMKQAISRYYTLKKDADSLRESWLRDLAAIKAKEKGGNQEAIYQSLLLRERQRKAGRRLRRAMGKVQHGLTQIEVTDGDGTREVTDKIGIENACHIENNSKYSQTNNTPMMRGQLAAEIGFIGTSPACRDILAGTYNPPPGTDQYTTEYLKYLKKDPNLHSTPSSYITTKEFQESWRKMKERTSSGNSGIHFGHMKSSARSTFLSDFESTLAHIPYSSGISPESWKSSTNVMLQKKKKSKHVSLLRTICLFEADFNHNNKKLGRDMLYCAEANKAIPKEQYGSRKNKRAILHAVNKRLLYNIIHLQRKPAMLCSNDARSCYDRIVHSIASMACQRLGLPPEPVTCMLVTIQEMEHHIRSSFGTSESMMSNQLPTPFQGICQGNGAGPAIWVAVSTPLIEMMRGAGHGISFEAPLSNTKDNIVGFAFVDDTDIIEGDLTSTGITINDVAQSMQSAIDRWEGGLKTTGGAIRPDKSFVYPISFTWDEKGNYTFESIEDINQPLTVKNHDDVREVLPQLEPSVGAETLGVYLAPDGSNTQQLQSMSEKVQKWCNNIKTGHLPAREAWQCISTTIMKTLQYPLPALTLTKKECRKLTSPIHEIGLPQSRICRKFPKDLVYGSTDTLGLGLDDLYVDQGTSKVEILLEHLYADNMTGSLLRSALEWSSIHVGIGQNIFSLDFGLYGHLLPQSWIKTLWQFASEYKITLPSSEKNLQLHRRGDIYLMEEYAHKGLRISELRAINKCRLFLQVTTLSDIIDGSGHRLCNLAKNGHKNNDRPSYHQWPIQSNPGPADWRIWRKAMRQSFPRDDHGNIIDGVGEWTDNRRNKWKWFYHPTSRSIFTKHNDTYWKRYIPNSPGGRIGNGTLFKFYNLSFSLPHNSQRCTIVRDHNKVRLKGFSSDLPTEEPPELLQEDRKMNWMVNNIYGINHSQQLVQHLQNGETLMAVSDGSYHPQHCIGTSAWIFKRSGDTVTVKGDNLVPGDPAIQCSHRSELSGIIGAVRHMNIICRRYEITEGNIELGCDGLEAFKVASRYDYDPTTRIKHYDLVSTLHQLIKDSPLTWTFRHVKGHQDNSITYDQIDEWGRLNIDADRFAKNRLQQAILNHDQPIHPTAINQSIPVIHFNHYNNNRYANTYIYSHVAKTLKHLIAQASSIKYWVSQRKDINHRFVHKESFLHAARNVPLWQRRWLSKWSSGICGVGKWLQRWKDQPHSKCLRCQTNNETVSHVIHCPHIDAAFVWATGVAELREWLDSNDASPGLVDIITCRLNQWRNQSGFTPIPGLNETLQRALTQQDFIGWDNFCFGLVGNAIVDIQKEYLTCRDNYTPVHAWISKMIRKVWDLQKKMWDHRNGYLHASDTSMHQVEVDAIDRVIRWEFVVGRNELPISFSGFFRGTVDRVLNKDAVSKAQWLHSIWLARDFYRSQQGLDPWPRDTVAATFLLRSTSRKKRRRNT